MTEGEAAVTVGSETAAALQPAPARRLQPARHEVRNAGAGTLRFFALYAAPEVVTRYEAPVQPAGEHERRPFG